MFGLVLASAIFATWTVLSILVLSSKMESRIRARDIFRLIPQWRFFAPTPNTSDYFVLYRDIFQNGTYTEWTELRRVPRHWWNGLLFPAKRERKSELDASMQLARMGTAKTLIERAVSIPYLTILNRVTHVSRWVEPESTQFAIATINLSAENPTIQVFCVSGLHRLK